MDADVTVSAENTIRRMVERIVDGFHPEQVILFGSRARAAAGPDADVDLLVIVQGPVHKRDLAVKIYRALAGMGLPKDVIVATRDEVERYRTLPGTVIFRAMREGVVLYERRP